METLTALLVGLSLLHPSPTLAETIPVIEAPQSVSSAIETVEEQITRLSFKMGVNPQIMLNISICERDPINPDKINYNSNGTADYSLFQINTIHVQDALKQGLDVVNSREDNIIYAIKLYKKNGLSDWTASASCRKHLISDS